VHFIEYEYYSAVHDAEVMRISASDKHGNEFYAIVPMRVVGRKLYERKLRAKEAIVAAIGEGSAPGEVIPAQDDEIIL
jgi:hypothetical protein